MVLVKCDICENRVWYDANNVYEVYIFDDYGNLHVDIVGTEECYHTIEIIDGEEYIMDYDSDCGQCRECVLRLPHLWHYCKHLKSRGANCEQILEINHHYMHDTFSDPLVKLEIEPTKQKPGFLSLSFTIRNGRLCPFTRYLKIEYPKSLKNWDKVYHYVFAIIRLKRFVRKWVEKSLEPGNFNYNLAKRDFDRLTGEKRPRLTN